MSFFGHSEQVSAGKFSPDGKYLVTGSEDMSMKVWDLKNQVLLHTVKGKKFHQETITSLSISQSRNLIASGSIKNEICITNLLNANVNFDHLNNLISLYSISNLEKKDIQSRTLASVTKINI
jgi:WD40 repeat protein